MKVYYRFLIFIAICVVLLFAIESSHEKPLDWNPYLTHDSKKPMGCFALHEVLQDFSGGNETKIISSPFASTDILDVEEASTLFIINTQFRADEFETARLLDFARNGNSIFIASGILPEPLKDSLGIRLISNWFSNFMQKGVDSIKSFRLVNPKLNSADFHFRNSEFYSSIGINDSDHIRVLSVDELANPVFVKISVGAGNIYLHSQPDVFGNFYLMSDQHRDYIYGCLSYLPSQTLLWDEYYKDYSRSARTPLRFILQSESLRWAYFILLSGIVLFVIFMGKRRQRAIPIVKAPANASLDFVKTIGRLYYQHGDHTGLAKKKISFFKDFLRSKLFMNTDLESAELARLVSEKSGYSLSPLLEIFRYADRLEQGHRASLTELSSLHSLLEGFYKHKK